MWPGVIVGQEPPVHPATQWDVWLAVAALFGIVMFGVWALYGVKRWREEAVPFDKLSHAEQLDHYRKMVDDGELDQREFDRIKDQLETRAGLRTPSPEETPPAPNQPPDSSIQEK